MLHLPAAEVCTRTSTAAPPRDSGLSNIVWLRSLQCVPSGKATRHHSHDCCNREELECNTKEGRIRRQAKNLLLQQRPSKHVHPRKTIVKRLLFFFSEQTQNYFLGCFLLKFALTVSAYLLAFGFTLQEVCQRSSSSFMAADNTTCLHIFTAR